MPTINWATKIIFVPQSELTFISAGRYGLDINTFRFALKDLEDSEEGMVYPTTHLHNTEVSLSGVTYARIFQIINGYTITFEDVGIPYSILVSGGNHNIADRKNVNQVSLIVGNSAGLISVNTSGGTVDVDEIASAVWNKLLADHQIAGSAGKALSTASSGGVDLQALVDGILDEPIASHLTAGTVGKSIQDTTSDVTTLLDIQAGNWEILETIMIFYKRDGTELLRYSLLDKNGMPSNKDVFKRLKL